MKTKLLSTTASAEAAVQDDLPLIAREAAVVAGLSLAAFWRAVAAGRLPAPVYPLPRAPRWFRSEIRSAMTATRALPADQKAARRNARLAAEAGQQTAA